jgi:hypothetical protein
VQGRITTRIVCEAFAITSRTFILHVFYDTNLRVKHRGQGMVSLTNTNIQISIQTQVNSNIDHFHTWFIVDQLGTVWICLIFYLIKIACANK